ncbi:hypothetical protein [Halobiforma nitratireducens]|nr:hypothetical protein [Halobiforma nitratireducens]
MSPDDGHRLSLPNRGIESVHSAILLFSFTIVLSLFMAGVIFLNGTGH